MKTQKVVAITVDDAVVWMVGPFGSTSEALGWMVAQDNLLSDMSMDYAKSHSRIVGGANMVEVDTVVLTMNDPEDFK
jgi:hypothetical protein